MRGLGAGMNRYGCQKTGIFVRSAVRVSFVLSTPTQPDFRGFLVGCVNKVVTYGRCRRRHSLVCLAVRQGYVDNGQQRRFAYLPEFFSPAVVSSTTPPRFRRFLAFCQRLRCPQVKFTRRPTTFSRGWIVLPMSESELLQLVEGLFRVDACAEFLVRSLDLADCRESPAPSDPVDQPPLGLLFRGLVEH